MKILKRIFSVTNDLDHKVVILFGAKIRFRTKYLTIKTTINSLKHELEKSNRTLGTLRQKLEKSSGTLDTLKHKLENSDGRFNTLECGLKTHASKLNDLTEKVNLVRRPLSYNKERWEFDYIKNFVHDLNNLDLRSRYRFLVNNLDYESIDTINRILTRCFIIDRDKNAQIDLYSSQEVQRILELRPCFFQRIFQIDQECWAFEQYYLPINHFEICVFKNKHEVESLHQDYFKNKNIIDAGGFIGDSAIVFSDYTKQKVYTFEPTKQNFALMQKTIALNGKTNIVPINKGLSDKDEELEIYFHGSASGMLDVKNTQTKEICSFTSLDKFVAENNLEVGLIKTDLEGMEQQFLKGAEHTIKTQRPTLLISIYHKADDFLNIKPLIESWNLGYKFRIVKPLDGQVLLETVLIAEI